MTWRCEASRPAFGTMLTKNSPLFGSAPAPICSPTAANALSISGFE